MTRSSKLVKIHSTRIQYTVYSKDKTMMRKKSCMPNGNMIKDRNKGISNITYNHLNLPTQIEFEGTNNKITYLYNSVGQKLKKTVVYSDSIKIVDYLDGFQYAGDRKSTRLNSSHVKISY